MMDWINSIREFIQGTKLEGGKPLLVLGGPTASGKTALSLALGKALNGEIISADSTQVYRGLDIGTDKVTVQERAEVQHHLIDIREPNESYTMADFKREASAAIEDILARGKVPILCGGTGLYLSSVTENYDLPIAPPDESLRAAADQMVEEKGKAFAVEFYHGELQRLDPAAAARIHPNNLRYVLRAMEIAKATAAPFIPGKKKPKYTSFKIAINWPREVLYERINARVDQQLQKGLLHEIKNLLDQNYSEDSQCFGALGYKEYFPYFKGEKALDACKEDLKQRTRNFAKRQLTWFRKDAGIHWMSPEDFWALTQGNSNKN